MLLNGTRLQVESNLISYGGTLEIIFCLILINENGHRGNEPDDMGHCSRNGSQTTATGNARMNFNLFPTFLCCYLGGHIGN